MSGISSDVQHMESSRLKGESSSEKAQNSSSSWVKWHTQEAKDAALDTRFWTSPRVQPYSSDTALFRMDSKMSGAYL